MTPFFTLAVKSAGAADVGDVDAPNSPTGDFSGISVDTDGSFCAASEYATNRPRSRRSPK